MGTTRIKVIDLSKETGPQALTRKKLKIKGRPVVEQKEEEKKEEIASKPAKEEQIGEKIEKEQEALEEIKVLRKKTKFARKRSEKYQNAKSLVDTQKSYPIEEAIDIAKKTSYARFDGSLEVHVVTSSKDFPKTVSLPHSSGKKAKVLVFTSKPDGIKKDGILIGDEKTLKDIEERKLVPQKDFQKVISTPDFMPKLAKVAKILGPKGLMPNPKYGTVTDDPKKVIEKLEEGLIELKPEPNALVVHLAIGKVSFESNKLKENLLALTSAIGLQRIKKLVISPTMGPGIKVDLSSINR